MTKGCAARVGSGTCAGFLVLLIPMANQSVWANYAITHNSSSQLRIERTIGSTTDVMHVYHLAAVGDEALSAYVIYSDGSDSTASFTAKVFVDEGLVTVEGVISRSVFRHETELLPDGVTFESVFENGSISATITGQRPIPMSEKAELTDFISMIPSDQVAMIAKAEEFQRGAIELEIADFELFNAASLAIAATGLGKPPFNTDGALQVFRDCMEEGCTDAGGCYNPQRFDECYFCGGESWWERQTITSMYTLAAAECLASFVSPFH